MTGFDFSVIPNAMPFLLQGLGLSYDLYTQVGRALRASDATNPLADLDVERLLAVGESQSAFALTTYVDGVQPLTNQFDGFLIHSRGGAAAPLC